MKSSIVSEDAIELLKSSSIFDQFVTDAMNDFEQFSKKKAEDNVKKLIDYLRNSFLRRYESRSVH